MGIPRAKEQKFFPSIEIDMVENNESTDGTVRNKFCKWILREASIILSEL